VTGSNRRPLRCKRGSEQTRFLLNRSISLVNAGFRCVVRCRGVAWHCGRLRNKCGTRRARNSPRPKARNRTRRPRPRPRPARGRETSPVCCERCHASSKSLSSSILGTRLTMSSSNVSGNRSNTFKSCRECSNISQKPASPSKPWLLTNLFRQRSSDGATQMQGPSYLRDRGWQPWSNG
jgi:hypothetical protein